MTALATIRMSSDEFIAWAMTRPEGERYELVAGEVVAMAPERASHARLKFRIARRLAEAIEAARLDCEAFTDGMAVQIDAATVYEPDAVVRCGPDLDDAAVKIVDPLIIVEVLSPSSRARDAGAKLEDYFRLRSLRHYLILKTENRTVIHHFRNEQGRIETRIIERGPVRLDPPQITLADIFPA
jgi:Uma2 family endonuclease